MQTANLFSWNTGVNYSVQNVACYQALNLKRILRLELAQLILPAFSINKNTSKHANPARVSCWWVINYAKCPYLLQFSVRVMTSSFWIQIFNTIRRTKIWNGIMSVLKQINHAATSIKLSWVRGCMTFRIAVLRMNYRRLSRWLYFLFWRINP